MRVVNAFCVAGLGDIVNGGLETFIVDRFSFLENGPLATIGSSATISGRRMTDILPPSAWADLTRTPATSIDAFGRFTCGKSVGAPFENPETRRPTGGGPARIRLLTKILGEQQSCRARLRRCSFLWGRRRPSFLRRLTTSRPHSLTRNAAAYKLPFPLASPTKPPTKIPNYGTGNKIISHKKKHQNPIALRVA